MPHHPSSELVAQAWLLTLPGITAGTVASTLPAKVSGTWPWEATGFYTVTPAGGTPHPHIPLRRPLIQVDAYAAKANTQRPPKGKAAALLELVINQCWDESANRAVTVDVKTGYYRAQVKQVQCVREPQPLYQDDGSLAKYSTDLLFSWMELAEVTA